MMSGTEAADSSYEFRHQKIWNYNPKRGDDRLGNVYPNACGTYTGELCTEYAFQGDEYWAAGVIVDPDPMPNAGAFRLSVATDVGVDEAGLDTARVLLDFQIPLIVAFDVMPEFKTPNADGYVTYVASTDKPLGGHAASVVGWVVNANLPAGAPAASGGGYFVIKNSWGENAGDCGYYYVPNDYLLQYGRSLTAIDLS